MKSLTTSTGIVPPPTAVIIQFPDLRARARAAELKSEEDRVRRLCLNKLGLELPGESASAIAAVIQDALKGMEKRDRG